jgi:2'-5' RNA ligase
MPFAVEMFFDDDANEVVRGVWADLAQANITTLMIDGAYRPHVSLSVFESYSSPGFQDQLRLFAKNLKPFQIKLDCLGIFPRPEGVVYFGAVVTEELLSVHCDFRARFAGLATRARAYYLPGNWIPHCTLGYGLSLDAIPSAVRVCSRAMRPITAKVKEVGLVEFPGHREVLTCELAPK